MRTDIDRTLKILLTVILAAVVAYFGWQVVQRVLYPLELFLMGAIVAFILSPLVDYLHKNNFPRPLAILVVYIALIGAISLLGYWLVSPLVNQITKLGNEIPGWGSELQQQITPRLKNLDVFLKGHGVKTNVSDTIQTQLSGYVSNFGQAATNNILLLVQTSFNFLVNMGLVLVIAFYLLLDGEQLKERLYVLVPESQLRRVTFVETTINEVLGGYLRGQLLMSLTIGTMAGVGVYGLGIHNYAVVVGVLAGILELVPMLGPWLASMPAVLIALFSPHPWPLTLFVGIYFAIIQQLESNVIGPRITGHAVGLHPLGALMALLVGIELDGILGALFAVPVAGILYVLAMAIYYNLTGRQPPIPPKSVPAGGLLTTLNLSGRMSWRSGNPEQDEGLRARIQAVRRRHTSPDGVVPRRLADMELKRDELLRDKLQQRADAGHRRLSEEQDAEAALGMAAPDDPPCGDDIAPRAVRAPDEEPARVR